MVGGAKCKAGHEKWQAKFQQKNGILQAKIQAKMAYWRLKFPPKCHIGGYRRPIGLNFLGRPRALTAILEAPGGILHPPLEAIWESGPAPVEAILGPGPCPLQANLGSGLPNIGQYVIQITGIASRRGGNTA